MAAAGPLVLAVVLAVVLVPSVLRSEELPFHRDLLDFFLPMKTHFARSVAAGHVPWWDPFTLGGQPFFASLQSQVLYPPNWIFLAASPGWALSAFIAAHFAWAGLGAHSLARELGASRVAAGLALLGVQAGGFLVSLADLLNQACAQSWLPWVLLAGARHGRSGSRRSLAAWAMACGGCFLAGEPQYAALGGAASLALAAAQAPPGTRLRRSLAAGALAAGLAMLACSVQLVPLAELVSRSSRAGESFQEGGRHALQPAALTALVRPPASAFSGPGGAFVESLHVGVAVLLGFAVLAFRRDRLSRTLLLLTLASIALALGPHLPLVGPAVVEATPWLRYPVKFFCVAAVLVPVGAALGAQALAARRPRWARFAPAVLAVVGCAELLGAQRGLVPSLPSGPLLQPTPLIAWLQRAAPPGGARVHAAPLTHDRLQRRARLMASGELPKAMRERVELLEGALPLHFGIASTWGATALPVRAQEALLQRADGVLTRELMGRLDAGLLLAPASQTYDLPRVPADGGAAMAFVLVTAPPVVLRRWDGPNRATAEPGTPPPSDYPGWREGPAGTWTFRPTGLVPLGILSAVTWVGLGAVACGARRPRREAPRDSCDVAERCASL